MSTFKNSTKCTQFYTDGSNDNDRVGCGLVIKNLSIKQRLPGNASLLPVEVTAIDLALDTISESDDDHFIIFSDSLSVLLSLHNKKMDNPLIYTKTPSFELRSQNYSFVLDS